MRAFIAIEITPAAKQQLRAQQDRLRNLPALRAQPSLLRWTDPGKMHLTLRFLGETEPPQRRRMKEGLAAIGNRHAPFKMALSGLGCFNSWRNMRVLWVGITGDSDALQAVQSEVELLSRQVGFAPVTNRFSPHITLARTARRAPRDALRAAAEQLRSAARHEDRQSQLEWRVNELHFIRSVLGRGGAQYFNLAICPLSAGN